MGRKIPSKKHRGVKDPLQQQAARLQSLKGKINAPPRDPDEQPVPRSLARLLAPQPTAARAPRRRAPPPAERRVAGAGAVRRLARGAGESARAFSLRINSAVRALRDPRALRYPHDEEMHDEDARGELMEARHERRRRRRAARVAASPGDGDGGTSAARRLLKAKEKKMKAAEAAAARPDLVYERVQFGEQAHAPPALRPPRTAPATLDTASRPGRRDLLLAGLLRTSGAAPPPCPALQPPRRAAPPPRPAAAELQRRERARLAAVAAYRALRATQRNTPAIKQNR